MRVAAALIFALAVLAPGCGTKTKLSPYMCVATPEQPEPDAQTLWECNREIMRKAVRGKGFAMRELELAADFFERLTGIAADLREIHLGQLPGPELKQNLRDWDAWYEGNGDRLVWDSADRIVKVAPLGA